MAFTSIMFNNPKTGAIKEAPAGFSWTVFFFGFFPPLFRGDFKWGIIMMMLQVLTLGFSNLVFMFIYNKCYIKDLIGAGFKAESISKGDIKYVNQKLGIKIPQLDSEKAA